MARGSTAPSGFAFLLFLSGLQGLPAQHSGTPQPTWDPIEHYREQMVEGWTVLVNRRLEEGAPELCARVLRVLQHQLYHIIRTVPEPALTELRRIRLWVERQDPNGFVKCMCYHPSSGWLRENGFNPEKAGDVEVGNAETFLSWTLDQPSMVLHELAHGYHHRVLGHDHPGLIACFQAARASGRYEKVLRKSGRRERAYALTNDQEYFAEATEAFFGTNDFYPFVRPELFEHDPLLFKLLEEIWTPGGDGSGPR